MIVAVVFAGRQLDSSYSVGEHGGARTFAAKIQREILRSVGVKHEATDNIFAPIIICNDSE